MDNKEEQEEKRLLNNLNMYGIIGGVLIFLALTIYTMKFGNVGSPLDNASWGAFGDFMGGTLNPLLAFLGLIALLTTIKLQVKELKATRKELETSSNALKEQSESFKIQNYSIKQQNFENTFFNMLDLHNKIVDNILLSHKPFYKKIVPDRGNPTGNEKVSSSIRWKQIEIPKNYIINGKKINLKDDMDFKGKKALARLLNILYLYFELEEATNLIDKEELYSNFHDEYKDLLGSYFKSIHHILKFIDHNERQGNIKDFKIYSDLFNFQLLPSELELLYFHFALYSDAQFLDTKPYIEKFKFFERLQSNKYMKEISDEYKNEAFGNNKVFKLLSNIN